MCDNNIIQPQKSKGFNRPEKFNNFYIYCMECNVWTPRNTPIFDINFPEFFKDLLHEFLISVCYDCFECNSLSYNFDGEYIHCWDCYKNINKKCDHNFCNGCDKISIIINTKTSECIDCLKCTDCNGFYDKDASLIEFYEFSYIKCISCTNKLNDIDDESDE
jgi:hypothetical protein